MSHELTKKVREARKSLTEKDVFYTSKFEILAKHFLREFANLELSFNDIFNLEFSEIREIFIKVFSTSVELVPNREVEFFTFICREYLGIEREPYQEMLSIHNEIVRDLQKISENIGKCENEKLEIQNNKSHKPKSINPIIFGPEAVQEERQSRQYVLSYYINRNIAARDDIFEYLASERIKIDAYRRSIPDKYGIFRQPLYTYQVVRDLYDINSFSVLSNKFLDLPIQKHHELKEKFYSDTSEFLSFSENYIIGNEVIQKLRSKIHVNHRLYKRKYILDFALDCFETDKRNIFVHLAGTQVEGLFYDYCLDMNFSKEQMNSLHSIERKLNELQKVDSGFLDLAYYMFEFPIIRNRIAHGKVVSDDEVNVWAVILILDLLDIFNRITSEILPVNKFLCAVNYALDYDQYEELFIALLLPLVDPLKKMSDILDFYTIQDKLDELKKKGRSEKFIQYLDKLLSLDSYQKLCFGVERVLNSLKKNDPETSKYKNLFRLIQAKKDYLKGFTFDLDKNLDSFLRQLHDANFQILDG